MKKAADKNAHIFMGVMALHMFGGMFVTIVVWFVTSRISPPPSINLFGFAGAASPLITHTLPWPAMGTFLIVSAILLWAALK